MIEFYNKDTGKILREDVSDNWIFVMNNKVWMNHTQYSESKGLDYKNFMDFIEPMTELDWREV